jgi:hypothetical protein
MFRPPHLRLSSVPLIRRGGGGTPAPPPEPTISYSPTTARVGEAYSLSPATSGPIASYALTSGTLPSWASLDTDTGVISGTPDVDGTTSGLVVTATGPGGSGASPSFEIESLPPAPTIFYSPATATEGEAYTLTPSTTGTITSFALASGTLPAGLSLDTDTGEISGTPTTEGTASGLVVTATGPGGSTPSSSFSIVVESGLVVFAGGAIDEADMLAALALVATADDAGDQTDAADLEIDGVVIGSGYRWAKASHGTSLTIDAATWATLVGSDHDDAEPTLLVLDAPSVTLSESIVLPRRPAWAIYCTGTLTVGSGVAIDVRGANHSDTGSDLTAQAVRWYTGTFDAVVNPQVPAAGGNGGTATSANSNGNAGSAGTGGGTGGGGTGGTGDGEAAAGAAGTSYAGGPGSGARRGTTAGTVPPSERGGVGGSATTSATGNRGLGGGGGNPGGNGVSLNSGVGAAGGSWVGGVALIVAGALAGSGSLRANGAAGGSATSGTTTDGGGGSGGGSITVMTEDASSWTGTIAANGGTGGTGTTRTGGAGGLGTARLLEDTLP